MALSDPVSTGAPRWKSEQAPAASSLWNCRALTGVPVLRALQYARDGTVLAVLVDVGLAASAGDRGRMRHMRSRYRDAAQAGIQADTTWIEGRGHHGHRGTECCTVEGKRVMVVATSSSRGQSFDSVLTGGRSDQGGATHAELATDLGKIGSDGESIQPVLRALAMAGQSKTLGSLVYNSMLVLEASAREAEQRRREEEQRRLVEERRRHEEVRRRAELRRKEEERRQQQEAARQKHGREWVADFLLVNLQIAPDDQMVTRLVAKLPQLLLLAEGGARAPGPANWGGRYLEGQGDIKLMVEKAMAQIAHEQEEELKKERLKDLERATAAAGEQGR